MERKYIKANDGYILTNGEIYGTIIFLADGMSEEDFHEISREEYDSMMNEDPLGADQATEEDYQSALREMGVNV